jgi:hypothetical protein
MGYRLLTVASLIYFNCKLAQPIKGQRGKCKFIAKTQIKFLKKIILETVCKEIIKPFVFCVWLIALTSNESWRYRLKIHGFQVAFQNRLLSVVFSSTMQRFFRLPIFWLIIESPCLVWS